MDAQMLMVVVTLHATNPVDLPDSLCREGATPNHLTGMNWYWSKVGGGGGWSLLRSHQWGDLFPAVDTLQVPDQPAASYEARPVNAAGESQCEPKRITVGVPAVGVNPRPMLLRPGYYDVMGRRLAVPLRSGRYFGARDTTVLR